MFKFIWFSKSYCSITLNSGENSSYWFCLNLLMNGWSNASSTFIRKNGLNWSNYSKKLRPSAGILGNRFENSNFGFFLNYWIYFEAVSSVMKLLSSSFGEPRRDNILKSWSLLDTGMPLIYDFLSWFFPGESGKHWEPWKSGSRTWWSS